MSTKLVETGLEFPDSTIQTTAASNYTHPANHAISDTTGLQAALDNVGLNKTKFSIAVTAAVGGTIIPWSEPWVGMVLWGANQECAGDTIESWMTSSCPMAGDQWVYASFFDTAAMMGYTLQTTTAEGTAPLEISFAVDTLNSYGNVLTAGNLPIDPNVSIDWGDGTTSTFADISDNKLIHDYGENAAGDIYSVQVTCKTGFNFSDTVDLQQYGDVKFTVNNPVANWVHTGTPADTPNLGSGRSIGTLTVDWVEDITQWDTSKVTDMSYLINSDNRTSATAFRQDISGWDVSNVTSFKSAFYSASYFNAPIGKWNTKSAEDMSSMFSSCDRFNQDISGWDTSRVSTMASMFYYTKRFFQDISGWDVSNVTDMKDMFNGSIPPPMQTADLSAWDICNVRYYNDAMASYGIRTKNAALDTRSLNEVGTRQHLSVSIFLGQDVSNYDISRITNMDDLLGKHPINGDSVPNPSIGSWDVSHVTSIKSMLGKSNFNEDISGWDVGSVTSMDSLFISPDVVFNQDISGWDVSSVTSMYNMFYNASVFNQDISGWDVSSVTSTNGMFRDATNFNQDLSNWDVNNVTDMGYMFRDATNFNQDISGWDVSNVTAMSSFRVNSALTCANSPDGFTPSSIGC